MSLNSFIIVVIIGGIALLIGLFGGGIEISQIKLPHLPGWQRVLSGLIGAVLIVLGLVLDPSVRNPLSVSIDVTPTATSVEVAQLPTTPSLKPSTEPEISSSPTDSSIAITSTLALPTTSRYTPTSVPPTNTFTPVPTVTNTPVPSPTNTPKPIPPTSTFTPVPATTVPTVQVVSRCELIKQNLPQSADGIANKFGIPVNSIFDVIHENCGDSIIDGFVYRSNQEVELTVPDGGCIDAPPDAYFSDPTGSNGVGGSRAFSGIVRASAITYRMFCYK